MSATLDDIAVGLVGWRQTTNSSLTIDAANLASRSGKYFQGASGLITPEILNDVQSDKEMSGAEFNTFLKNISKDVLKDIARSVFRHEEIIESRMLYPYPDNWGSFLDNEGDFVGYEITPVMDITIQALVKQVFAEFDETTTGGVKLLLFHSSKNALIDSLELDTTANTAVSNACTWVLKHLNEYNGGHFYIGYLTSGLSPKGLNRAYELSNEAAVFNCLGIRSIKVSGWNAETLFDIEDIEYVSETFGLNFQINSTYDFTTVIRNNENSFSKALQLGVGVRVLNEIATSSRSNRLERVSKGEALLELNGNKLSNELPYTVGLVETFKKEIDCLRDQFADPSIIQLTLG